jgi:geranylgeranylglycerol-phosphate geranylgeranyltransferase
MRNYLKLSRIGNVVITFLSVECAGILCGVNVTTNLEILSAAFAASLITAGGNAVNDLFDIDVDRINRPNRPLVSGALSVKQAKIFYTITTSLGLVLSARINIYSFLIAVVAVFMIFLYSFKLKRSVFLGNLVVALAAGLTFIYAGVSVKDLPDIYPAAVFAFLTNLIREIIKDAEDVKGDSQIGIRTIATSHGTTVSTWLSISLTVILLLLIFGAYGLRILPVQFFVVCMLTIFPLGIYVIYLLIERRGFPEASFGYKLIMVFGLIALIVGKV